MDPEGSLVYLQAPAICTCWVRAVQCIQYVSLFKHPSEYYHQCL